MLIIPLLILAEAFSSNGEGAGRVKRQLSSICENNDLEEMHGYVAQLAASSPAFPWKTLRPPPKIFRSRTPPVPQPSLLYNWKWIKALSVRGLNETVDEVIAYYDQRKCAIVAVGDVARDAILGLHARNFDAVISCDLDSVYAFCIRRYTNASCMRVNDSVTIGDPLAPRSNEFSMNALRFFTWSHFFERELWQWEFTADSMAIYEDPKGALFIIDTLGTRAWRDVCSKRIELPVGQADYDNWTEEDLGKVLRYYLFRAQRLADYPPQFTADFIADSVKRLFNVDVLRRFYCTQVLEGVWQADEVGSRCLTVLLDEELDTRAERFSRELLADFDAEWKDKLLGAIDHMKMEVLGESANAVDVVSDGKETSPPSIAMRQPSTLSSDELADVQPTSKNSSVLASQRIDASVAATEGESLMMVRLDLLPAADHLFGDSVFVAPEALRPTSERDVDAEDHRFESGEYATSSGTLDYDECLQITALAFVAFLIQYAYVGVVVLLIALLAP